MKTKLLSLVAAAVGPVGIFCPDSADAQTSFSVVLVGVQVVPTNASPALGTGTLTLNAGSTTTLTYFITYSGLTGDFTFAHIHGPAGEGTNTGFIFTLSNFANGTHAGMLTGTTAALTPQQVTNLQTGLNYADIHSTAFGIGEIRGQIVGPITNSWTNSGSGLWSNAANWLVGSPSVNHDIELITNANTKTVFMTGTVAAATLVVRSLAVGAPAGQTNTLQISNQTFRILNSLSVATGGAVLLQAGTTQVVAGVSGGGFIIDGRVTLTNPSSVIASNVSTIVGSTGNGILTNVGGSVIVNQLTVGELGGATGALTMASGTVTVSGGLTVGASSNSFGRVRLDGGRLVVTNAATIIGMSGGGSLTLFGGTLIASDLTLGQLSNSSGGLSLLGGDCTVSSNLVVGRFDCASSAGIGVTLGSLAVTNSAGNAVLEIRDGSIGLQADGTLKIDRLVITNACGQFFNFGGSLSITTTNLGSDFDADGDGLPNGWETSFGLSPFNHLSNNGPNGDPDGDGLSNLNEYEAGTDPTNSASVAKDGYHTVKGFTTGGEGGTVVTVTTAGDFISAVAQTGPYIVKVKGTINLGAGNIPVTANKTILGLGTNATLIGCVKMNLGSNLVVRNVSFTNPSGTGDGDGLTIQRSHHIWVEHCTFYDCADGELDMTHAVDYVTVSRCKFYYTFDSGHNLVSLIGHDDGNAAEDTGKFHITFHHNWWSAMCTARMPRVRFGRVHSYNDYFNVIVPDVFTNGACVQAGLESQVLLEKNYFENVNTPWEKIITIGTTGKVYALSNALVNVTEQFDPGFDFIPKPPYVYTLDNTNSVPAAVTNFAGAGQLGPGGDPFALWQQLYFGCTNCPEASATADPDNDGWTNNDEFQAGSDPTDPNSVPFRMTAIAREGNDIRITWTTFGGATNCVQVSTGAANGSFTNNFSNLSPDMIIPGTGLTSTNYVDVGGATNVPARYYRVRENAAQGARFLFDAGHAQSAGNADWVVDADVRNISWNNTGTFTLTGSDSNAQRIPTPAASGIISNTPETYWAGALSAWAVDLVKRGHSVETLPAGATFTYNTANSQDLTNYDVVVVDEPNILFTLAEKQALLSFVSNGGSLFMISDHVVSDRNGDGQDSVSIWNDFLTNNLVTNNPFGLIFRSTGTGSNSSGSNTFSRSIAGNPILNGPVGVATNLEFFNGNEFQIDNTKNPTVVSHMWFGTLGDSNNFCGLATLEYVNGRVVVVGDSSCIEDGTGDPGDSLFNGYTLDAGGVQHIWILNASEWLAAPFP